jgi:hypothetical protein
MERHALFSKSKKVVTESGAWPPLGWPEAGMRDRSLVPVAILSSPPTLWK